MPKAASIKPTDHCSHKQLCIKKKITIHKIILCETRSEVWLHFTCIFWIKINCSQFSYCSL